MVQVRVIDAKGKATISFHQDKLLDNKQREEMNVHWSAIQERLKEELVRQNYTREKSHEPTQNT